MSNAAMNIAESVRLGAVNAQYFCHTFFPKTFRQESPRMVDQVWEALDSNNRLVNIQFPRGFGKTSILRAFAARRIAYGFARTVLYVGRNETAAVRSSLWLRRQIEHNRLLTTAFGLRPGSKTRDTEMEIVHDVGGYTSWVVAAGITSGLRGINLDDYRPDLIILDDVLDDENCLTDDQREKMTDLIYGAVLQSLAPETESPDAKMVMLQTPLHQQDASTRALSDPAWRSIRLSCWTKETEDLELSHQESSWPERYPSPTLRTEKRTYIQRNKLSVFTREKECRLIAREKCSFKIEWLKYYDVAPIVGQKVLIIDPVPPPSPKQLEKNLHDKDYECLMVVQRTGNDYYVLEYKTNRGHNPDWTIATFFSLAFRHNPKFVVVESVAYQRTLAWLLRRGMEKQGKFWAVDEYTDQRPKFNRITDAITGVASEGHLYVKSSMTELIAQFEEYKYVEHDDVLECCALGISKLEQAMFDDLETPDDDIEDAELIGAYGAP